MQRGEQMTVSDLMSIEEVIKAFGLTEGKKHQASDWVKNQFRNINAAAPYLRLQVEKVRDQRDSAVAAYFRQH